MRRFQLWFPFTPGVIGIAEEELPKTHNRTFASVLQAMTHDGQWKCEQAYLTDRLHPYQVEGQVLNRFFPVSFRWRASSRLGARQWSLTGLEHVLVAPPQAMAIFSAYGLFPKALALAARIRRVPYIVIVAGWYNRISKSQRWYFDHAFRVLVHTEMQKQALVDVGYRSANIEVFPLGVDTQMFSPKSAEGYALRTDWPRLLYVGRLQPSKGPLEALQTFEVVKRHHPKATMKIAGPCNDQPFMQHMVDYVRENGLTDSVTFTGPVDYSDLPRYYQEADLFLFPSPYEGLPSVVLESMACGTPPVVLRGSGGTAEAVLDGHAGWVVDVPRLAYEVLQILADPAQMRRAGENGVQRIRQVYSFQRTYDQLTGILNATTGTGVLRKTPADSLV